MNPRMTIWIAIVFSTVIYLVLVVMLSGEAGEFEQLARDRYVPVLYVLAGVMFAVGWFVMRRVVKGNAQTRMVVTLGVFESCAVFGLMAAFLTKDWRLYLFPWALALVGFIRELPRDGATEPPAPV